MKKLFFITAVAAVFAACKDDAPLTATQTDFTVPAAKTEFEFKLSGDASWTVTGYEEYDQWLFVGPTSGTGKGTVFLGTEENERFRDRSATLTLEIEGQPPIPIRITQQAALPDFARIELVVDGMWWNYYGDEGFQMLFDPGHTLYGSKFPNASLTAASGIGVFGTSPSTANLFTHKIPANANGTGQHVIQQGMTATLAIPPGTYDYAIILPLDWLGLLLTPLDDDGHAVGDDVEFLGGWKYTFTITVAPGSKADFGYGPMEEGIPSVALTKVDLVALDQQDE